MSKSDPPDLKPLAQMREEMLKTLESSGEGQKMEGLSLERLRDAMHRPHALETMAEMMKSGPGNANPGNPAPDFDLPYLPGQPGFEDKRARLSDHAGSRPVALIFGSYT